MEEEMGRPSGEHLANSIDDLYFLALLADPEDLLPDSVEKQKQTPVPESGEEISLVLDDKHAGILLLQELYSSSPLAAACYLAVLRDPEALLPDSVEKQAPVLDSGKEISQVLDENYSRLLLFQEMLFSSTAAAAASPPSAHSSMHQHQPSCGCLMATSSLPETAIMTGESSCKRTFCDICLEARLLPEMFSNPNCGHIFCKQCVSSYISVSLQENVTAVKCLASGCGGALEPEHCRELLPADVFDRWGTALCEAMFLGWRRFYCPFRDCSAPLLDDGEGDVRESECPHCHRLFCAQCGVPWHAGVECEEFQQLGEDERGSQDLILLDMAKNKNWKRCPTCRFYVEKGEGCLHITCRCGFQFCYGCGSTWNESHTSCHT